MYMSQLVQRQDHSGTITLSELKSVSGTSSVFCLVRGFVISFWLSTFELRLYLGRLSLRCPSRGHWRRKGVYFTKQVKNLLAEN